MNTSSSNFWETAYQQNIAWMIGICYRYTQNRHTAEDLAHNAFLLAIDKISGFQHKGPFEAWLRRVVINVALQHLRDQKKQQQFEKILIYSTHYSEFGEESNKQETLQFSQSTVLELIDCLPEHHRMVFNLYVIDKFTHAEIGQQLGISEGTSKSHLARARKKLRVLLQERYMKHNQEKKLLLFIIPFKFRNIDPIFTKPLNEISITPSRPLHGGKEGFDKLPDPQELFLDNPAKILNTFAVCTGMVATSVVAISFLYFFFSKKDNLTDHKALQAALPVTVIPDNSSQATKNFFSDSQRATATISQNSIIPVEKTKSENMKHFTAFGALLISGLAVDTTTALSHLPLEYNKQPLADHSIMVPLKAGDSIPKLSTQNTVRLKGTFYASRLFWSDADNELYLKGDDVKVNLNTQRFTGSGTFSFISRLKLVVVDGKEMQLNETVELLHQKYQLKELKVEDAIKKYGEKGNGIVVEINAAE